MPAAIEVNLIVRRVREEAGIRAGWSSSPVGLLAASLAALFAATAAFAGLDWDRHLILTLPLGGMLVTLSAYDVWRLRLPNALTLPLAVGGVAAAYIGDRDVIQSVVAGAIGYGALALLTFTYRRYRGRDGLGPGDAKLFGAAGTWVGLEGLAQVLLVASATALAGALFVQLAGVRITRETRIPFGPFIAYGTWLVWLYGPLH